MPGRRGGVVLIGLMLFVPLYLHTAAWQAGFGISGWVPAALDTSAWLQGWTGAIWVHGMAAVPWVVLIVGVGLRLAAAELEEQALLDGSAWQVFRRVTLPGALPAIGIATLWVAVLAAGEITVVNLFMVPTYADELFMQMDGGLQSAEITIGVMPGVLLTALLLAAGLAICMKLAPGREPISLRRGFVFRLRRWRIPVAIAVGMMIVWIVGVPLVNLCVKAGVTVEQIGDERHRGWSLGKGLAIVAAAPWQHRRELGWSLMIGSAAATAALIGGILLGWFARRGTVRAGVVLTIVAFCLAVPGPVVAVGIIRMLNRPDSPMLCALYDRSIFAPWLALSIRALPAATLIAWHALRTVPEAMLESAAVDGAGPVRRLFLIALPCRMPAIAMAWVVALAITQADVAASVLVLPPGVTTMSIRLFGLLHSGVEDQVAGICLALMTAFAAVAAIAAKLAQRWGQ